MQVEKFPGMGHKRLEPDRGKEDETKWRDATIIYEIIDAVVGGHIGRF